MRKIRAGLGLAALGAALAVAVAPASAAKPLPTATITSPADNTVVFRITNHLDEVTSCGGRLNGFTDFSTPYAKVAPRSTVVYTVADVPAGNYSAWWGCNGFDDRNLVMVRGKSTGKPYLAPNKPSYTPPAPGLDFGSLSSALGS